MINVFFYFFNIYIYIYIYIYILFVQLTVYDFTFMHLADAFIQSDLQEHSGYTFVFFFISMCVPWELTPQPFALLTQCSTTELQEQYFASLVLYAPFRSIEKFLTK